jgi:hypothetical protein
MVGQVDGREGRKERMKERRNEGGTGTRVGYVGGMPHAGIGRHEVA